MVSFFPADKGFSVLFVSKDCNITKQCPAGGCKISTGEKTETFCSRSVFSCWLRRQEIEPFLSETMKDSMGCLLRIKREITNAWKKQFSTDFSYWLQPRGNFFFQQAWRMGLPISKPRSWGGNPYFLALTLSLNVCTPRSQKGLPKIPSGSLTVLTLLSPLSNSLSREKLTENAHGQSYGFRDGNRSSWVNGWSSGSR